MTSDRTSPSFLPALEGVRGLAALGVVVTHVAFQTGAIAVPVLGRILGRFDLAVAVFFALSGFVLWRGPAADARRRGRPRFAVGSYLLQRAARILPGYWVVVFVVLLLLPGAATGRQVWFANLALVQVFVPLTLTQGLTQMWSLSVEVAFYLVLPLFAPALAPLRARWRAPVILAGALCCLGWGFVPIATPDGIHSTTWLPGYLPWFAAGMVLAELAAAPPMWFRRLARRRHALWTVAVVAFLLAATDLAGPVGLAALTPWQFADKIALGAVLGFTLLAPLALGDGPAELSGPTALTIGRWSYGIFLWHVAVLAIIFPVFAILPFHGHFLFVLLLTVALTLPLAAAGYAFVEDPVRVRVKRLGNAAIPTAATATSAGS